MSISFYLALFSFIVYSLPLAAKSLTSSFHQVHVRPQDLLEIKFLSSRTAGYLWILNSVPSLLKPLTLAPLPDGSALYSTSFAPLSKRLGGPGQEVFKFYVQKEGQASLTFMLKRPWEKDFQARTTLQVVSRRGG